MKTKIVLLIVIIFICFSCISYKFKFVPIGEDTSEKISDLTQGYLKRDNLFVGFADSYKNTKIKIVENDNILFDSLMTTGSGEVKEMAKAFKINKLSIVKIYFDRHEKPLILLPEQMKEYKFVYVYKKGNRITAEFNNGTKKLSHYR